jgi:hypothetical protein
VRADAAQAEHGDAAAGQLGGAEPLRGHGPQRGQHAGGGGAGRVTAAAGGDRAAEHMRGTLRDRHHVVRAGADVRAGGVRAVQCGDRVADVVPDGLPPPLVHGLAGGHRDDRLAAAVRQPGQGALVGHRSGQPQGVGQAVLPRRVRRQPAPADGLAERGGVHRDDDRQPGAGAALDEDALVAEGHGRSPHL